MNMAEDITGSPNESESSFPRAPPPSPECPAHTTDLSQFDFTALLINNQQKKGQQQQDYYSQQQQVSFNHQSPPLSRQESGNTSPSWNESGSYTSHSPFFLPSPEHFSDRYISGPSSPIHSSTCNSISSTCNSVGFPNHNSGMLLASFHESAHESRPPNHILSISLPVNGDLQQLGPRPFFTQQDRALFTIDPSGCGFGVATETERRRKTSLKRSHDQSQEVWSNSYDQAWHQQQNDDILQKKLCFEVRDRENRHFNHHRSPSPQRTRAFTHSGISNNPLSSDFNKLTLKRADNSFPNVPQTPHSYHDHAHQSHTQQVSPFHGSHIGSHVIPQATPTVGFVMTENHTPDVPMETGDMLGALTHQSQQMTKISITRAESIEYNLMDTAHTHSSSNKTYSFSLGSSNFNPDSLHPNGGGAFTQGTPISRSPNDLFSQSL